MTAIDALPPSPIPGAPGFDISKEAWREYVYPGGKVLRVEGAVRLFVDKRPDGDRHRLIVSKGVAGEVGMYVTPGWLAIRWQTPDKQHGITF
jgi:hypothetical protein